MKLAAAHEGHAVKLREWETLRWAALAADHLRPAPNIIHQPRGVAQVIRIATDFAAVLCRGHQLGRHDFGPKPHHQVGLPQLVPEFRQDERHGAARAALEVETQRVHGEVMRSDVRAVPVFGVGSEDNIGAKPVEEGGERFDLCAPLLRPRIAILQVHVLQTRRMFGHLQSKAEDAAGGFQFPQAPRALVELAT